MCFGESSQHIIIDQLENFLLFAVSLESRFLDVGLDEGVVVFSFSGEGVFSALFACWGVLE